MRTGGEASYAIATQMLSRSTQVSSSPGSRWPPPAPSLVGAPISYSPVPVNNLVDAGISKRFTSGARRKLTWSLNVTNLFDQRVATFAGTPAIGRLALTRVSTTF